MRARHLIILPLLTALFACEEPPPAAPPQPPPPAETAAPATSAAPAPPPPQADANLIARRRLFGNPDRVAPRISPDGKRILFIAPSEGVLNVWVAPADDPKAAKVVTHERTRPIRTAMWAQTGEHVLYQNDKNGDENFHIFVVDLKTGKEKDLTPFDGVRASIEDTFDKKPKLVCGAMNRRDKKAMDPFLVDIDTGKIDILAENTQGFEEYLTDADARLGAARKGQPDGSIEYFVPDKKKKGEWASFTKIPQEDSLTTVAWGFDRSGKTLYFQDSRGRDTAALVAFDVSNGKSKLLFDDAKSDVQGIAVDQKTLRPVAVSTNHLRRDWHALDKTVAADLEALKKVARGDLVLSGASRDDKRWIVTFVRDDGPTAFYLWDRKDKKATLLFTDRPDLEKEKLSRMHPVVIKARDGLDLVSYLTLPLSADADQDGKPDAAPIPLVLLVHGGPWARDNWGFNPQHQWLASRGYAVLSVNYRASTGLGKRFLNAGNKEWAGKAHDDLLDAVEWAKAQKIADPQKIAIMGGSYGGYATLVGLTFTPEVFACGVDIVGPSNLVTLLNTIPPYWAPMIETFTTRVGDHRTEEGKQFLLSRSPLSRVDAIKRPLLIGQGANDPRVKQAESDQIVKAMQQKGLPVAYVLYPDEGHGFARPENRMSFNAVAETFLAQHLGGKYQPVGDDFKGSSIQVPAGADQVFGIKEALPKGP